MTKPPLIESSSNPSLPDDLLLSCFARVSRLYYPTLYLVSKRFRSLLASPEFHEARSLLGRAESCLYVCLRFPHDPELRWFTLCSKPKSNGYFLATISITNSPPLTKLSKDFVAVGYNIYNIGGSIEYSSSFSILDCKSHTWREGPKMLFKRMSPSVSFLDGKIYVTGGSKSRKPSKSIEAFDPETQTWESVFNPGMKLYGCKISAVIDGKIYMLDETMEGDNDVATNVVYGPKDGSRYDYFKRMERDWEGYWYCVIENVLFCLFDFYGDHGKELKWYDTKAMSWRNLQGLQLPEISKDTSVIVAAYDGKMVVFWDEFVPSCGCKNRVICCAVIAFEKRDGYDDQIWGKIESLDCVLTVPKNYEFVCALSPTV